MAPSVLPGDFCVRQLAGEFGPVVDMGEWLQRSIQCRKLGLNPKFFQQFSHSEIYLGGNQTASAYPNREGIRVFTGAPEDMPGAMWSSGVIPLMDSQRAAIVRWCVARPDVPYSGLEYFVIASNTLGLQQKWLEKHIDDTGQYICSYYTQAAYMAGDVDLSPPGEWPGMLTPLDLALKLEGLGVAWPDGTEGVPR